MGIYNILLALLTPFIWLKILKFSRNKHYRIAQAFGFQKKHLSANLWVHCASVGEVLASKPVIDTWHEQHPKDIVLITTMTPTGAAQVKKSFSEGVVHRFLPIDWSGAVKRFLKQLDCPKLLIIETELWPNLLDKAKAKGIEIHIINARMSDRSFRKYSKSPNLTRYIMSLPDQFCTHHQVDADRFLKLGARSVIVTGNIKFDLQINPEVYAADWRAKLSNEFVWIAASTHEKEDELLLKEHKELKSQTPNALLIIVPRHPERFQMVYKLACLQFKKVGKRSETPIDKWHTLDVLVGDSMGEMMYYYQASDVAFVAGSLIERGGHNPIEPALLAKPILVGAHTFNFAEITEGIIQAGGAIRCKHPEVIGKLLMAYADSKELIEEAGLAAQKFAKQNQGAVQRVLEQINHFGKA